MNEKRNCEDMEGEREKGRVEEGEWGTMDSERTRRDERRQSDRQRERVEGGEGQRHKEKKRTRGNESCLIIPTQRHEGGGKWGGQERQTDRH